MRRLGLAGDEVPSLLEGFIDRHLGLIASLLRARLTDPDRFFAHAVSGNKLCVIGAMIGIERFESNFAVEPELQVHRREMPKRPLSELIELYHPTEEIYDEAEISPPLRRSTLMAVPATAPSADRRRRGYRRCQTAADRDRATSGRLCLRPARLAICIMGADGAAKAADAFSSRSGNGMKNQTSAALNAALAIGESN